MRLKEWITHNITGDGNADFASEAKQAEAPSIFDLEVPDVPDPPNGEPAPEYVAGLFGGALQGIAASVVINVLRKIIHSGNKK